jgi:hypothetical protein
MMRKLVLTAMITAIALLGGCSGCVPDLPEARDSDAGDYSWVRQAVPKIAGRKAHGYVEVKVLADMVAASDRATTLRAMLRQTTMKQEYVDQWGENVVDFMRAHRESDKGITASSQCLGTARRVGDYTLGLAQFVRDNGPVSTAPGAAFNLSDLLRSSLVLDDMSPAYRAYLFGMISQPIGGNEITEQNKRDDLGVTFVQVYTHRQLGCLGCHNTIASTTGPETFWNRHYPIRGRFTHGLYGQNSGRPADEVHAMLRTDVASGSLLPWGLSNCGSFVAAASVPNDTFTTPGGMPLNAFFVTPRGRKGSVWQLESSLDTGVQNIAARGLVRGRQSGTSSGQCGYCTTSGSCPSGSGTAIPPVTPVQIAQENAARAALQGAGCFGCHSGGSGGLTMTSGNFPVRTMGLTASTDSAKLLVWPGDATRSYLFEKISSATDPLPDGSPRMPPGSAMSMAGINAVRDWINGLTPAAGCGSCPTSGCETDFVDGNDAFAFLTASRLVENSWSEVMGQPLTVPNHFPRNLGQRDILWNLTELHFVRGHWSMENLLSRMMTSEYFNRLPPATTTGPSAYELPNYLDPWAASDPRVPPVALPGTPPGSGTAPTPDPAYDKDDEANRPHEYNSMTDGVHRYAPRSLLYSVHAALGWPSPPRHVSGASYPNDTLRKSLGQFYRDAEPGFRELGFQGLLQWEGAHGICAKPANHVGDDWIDKLAQAVTAFNAANPGSPVKVRDVVLALKDRIIVDSSIQTSTPTDAPSSETVALQALFGGPLTSNVDVSTAAAIAALIQKMRGYCGVLLETPQFFLAGIAPGQLGEKPRLSVCLAGEPCGYQAVCESYADAWHALGKQLTCTDNSVALADLPPFQFPPLDRFCRKGACAALPFEVRSLPDCLKSPRLCLPEPPPCDPRCARIDCCGGPLPPISGRELFVIWGDGIKVREASGVRILGKDRDDFSTLEPGMTLATGDVLVLSTDASLKAGDDKAGFETPKGGLGSRHEGQQVWLVQITGPQAIAPARREMEIRAVNMAQAVDTANNAYWLQSGEAGAPTIPGLKRASSDIPGRSKAPAATPRTLDFDVQKKYERRERELAEKRPVTPQPN